MDKLKIMQVARNKIRVATDQLNYLNDFSVEVDEGIGFATLQLEKVIQYLTARTQMESELSNAGTK